MLDTDTRRRIDACRDILVGKGLANGVPICELGVPCAFNQDIKAIQPTGVVDATYLRLILKQQTAQFQKILETAAHGTLKINIADLLNIQFALPDLPTQRAIIAEIEAEQALVDANRELIRRMEAKIKSAIDRVWGTSQAPTPASTVGAPGPMGEAATHDVSSAARGTGSKSAEGIVHPSSSAAEPLTL